MDDFKKPAFDVDQIMTATFKIDDFPKTVFDMDQIIAAPFKIDDFPNLHLTQIKS